MSGGCIAVIPARGGSKRIPRKNIRSFAGKPMIAHSIECALRSRLFDRVIVSTEDDKIAAVARDHGADVPFMRPANLADDHATTDAVMAHVVDRFAADGRSIAAACCIYPTAPFLRPDDLRRGLELLESGRHRFVFAATDFGYPVQRAFREAPGQGLQMLFPEHANTRSQDLERILHDAGQFYWGTADAWSAQEDVFGAHSAVVHIPRWRVQDIDTEDDWIRAEAMSRYLANG